MSFQEPQWDNQHDATQWEDAEATMAARAAMRHIPLGATFELTPFCNLRCKMCYIRLDKNQADKIGRQLTTQEWISIADDAVAAGTLNLLITGGEPLLRPDFKELYSALTDRPFIISLNTNATLIDEEYLELFKRRPPTSIAVTLYGASPETYEKVCGDPGAFERTIRGLEMLKNVPTNLEVRTTFIQDNMHELDALRNIANRYTKRFAINTSVYKAVRGAVSDVEACRLTAEQAHDIDDAHIRHYMNTAETAEKAAAEKERPQKYNGFDLPPEILECMAAKSLYWISWDGKMLPCGSFAHPYTLPLEEGFKRAWDRLPTLFGDVCLPSKCETCEYNVFGCPNCPANTQMETGDFTIVAPYLCEMAKERRRRYLQRLNNME